MNDRRARQGRVVGVAGGVAAAVRRRQREREPRVLVADGTGSPRVVAPSAPGYDEVLDTADRLLELVGLIPRESRRRSGGRSSRRAGDPDG